jgi:CyaY protein
MPEPIDEARFDTLADRALRALDVALNEVDGIEADLESGILTIEFEDGVRFIVNSHRAARQIWMAAGAQAWHFDVDAGTEVWTAKKTGDELWSCIAGQVGLKLGRPLELASR